MKIVIKCPNCGENIEENLDNLKEVEGDSELEIHCFECTEYILYNIKIEVIIL